MNQPKPQVTSKKQKLYQHMLGNCPYAVRLKSSDPAGLQLLPVRLNPLQSPPGWPHQQLPCELSGVGAAPDMLSDLPGCA